MIVVDLGAADWGNDRSLSKLAERFTPEIIYGFDPRLRDGTWPLAHGVTTTLIVQRSLAAWTHRRTMGWVEDGSSSHVVPETDSPAVVETFDVAQLIHLLPTADKPVLKLDIEGAEYPVLRHLHFFGLDARLERILVEWHGDPLDLPWRCPVEAWE